MRYPKKLSTNDLIRVIAPARSLNIISNAVRSVANERFSGLKLNISFGKNVEKIDEFSSSSTNDRLEDLHDAFRDPNVKGILTAIGGFNSNQLLDYIDWEVINKNPKVFCGFSDITVLNNAILQKVGLVSYSGPHYSTFGQKEHFEYTLEHFIKAVMGEDSISISPSNRWSDDVWFLKQDNRKLIDNPGFLVLNEGESEGTIIGGNLTALASLKGTEYFPNLTESILFIEDDEEVQPHHFDRLIQSLIQLPSFKEVTGIVIGRFQKKSEFTEEKLKKIIKGKSELSKIPVLANVDFGHTDPKITFPVGGKARLVVSKEGKSLLEITGH